MMNIHRKQDLEVALRTRIPNCNIDILDVPKNNGVLRTGVSIRNPKSNLSPIYYIDECLEKNWSDKQIADWVIEQYSDNELYSEPFSSVKSLFQNYEDVVPKLTVALINKKNNTELFKTVPYKPFLDLAVIVVLIFGKIDQMRATIKITYNLLNTLGVSFDTIFGDAFSNFKKEKGRLSLIEDLLREANIDILDEPVPMYALTNEECLNGATQILNEEAMNAFANMLNSDIIVIPSSIHDCLLIPYDARVDFDSLNEMVQEVNATHCEKEEVLSDHVYLFKRDEGWYNY